MAELKRKAALSIGISDAMDLPYLAGALNGAKAFHGWASAAGYESTLLTDEGSRPVTIDRLEEAFLNILDPLRRADDAMTERIPPHRLLIYFAGHGLIRDAEEGLWLLSDWRQKLRAVAIEALKRRLFRYGIAQIAIFSDACRSLPIDMEAADLCPDPVLGMGPFTSKNPAIDKFIATSDGSKTFVIPGATPAEDRCLFSGILLEGLWGCQDKAFSRVKQGKITSRSLGTYLEKEVAALAARYHFVIRPVVSPTFPEEDDVYFGDAPPTAPRPIFPAWPDSLPSAGDVTGLDNIRGLTQDKLHLDDSVDKLTFALALLVDPLREWLEPELRLPDSEDAWSSDNLHQWRSGSGFAIHGGAVEEIWTPTNAFVERRGLFEAWGVGEETKTGSSTKPFKQIPVLIEFTDGRFGALTGLSNFVGSVTLDKRGITSLLYRPTGYGQDLTLAAERAIAQMENGQLRPDATLDLAVELRQSKHVDPTLGVIAAYLYDSIGDVNSIRRMAFFYAAENQPIPYDVALLSQITAHREGAYEFSVRVPAVPARSPASHKELNVTWTYQETPSTTGIVGGMWPWMTQGWSLLEDPTDDGSELLWPGLLNLVEHLQRARFATLDEPGGRQLINTLGLVRARRVT